MITGCDNIPQIKGWISRIVNNTYYARFHISINDKNSGRLLHLLPDCKKQDKTGYNPNWSRAASELFQFRRRGGRGRGRGDHGPRCVADPRREAAPGWATPTPTQAEKGGARRPEGTGIYATSTRHDFWVLSLCLFVFEYRCLHCVCLSLRLQVHCAGGQRKKWGRGLFDSGWKIPGAIPEIWENIPLYDLLTYLTGRLEGLIPMDSGNWFREFENSVIYRSGFAGISWFRFHWSLIQFDISAW